MISGLVALLDGAGFDWQAWTRAWLRVLPSVTLVPAFGARFLPVQARAVLGLGLAAMLVPAMGETVAGAPYWASFGSDFLSGVPVALTASATLWATAMAGGLFDDIRGASQSQVSLLSEAPTPMGTLLALFACVGFLQLGGVEQIVMALAAPEPSASVAWLRATQQLVAGIHVAFALAAPFMVASVVLDVAGALVARAAAPGSIQNLLTPLRSLALLATFALVLRALLRTILQLVGPK
jgi:flagellar biosynthesis protein FliR